MKYYEISCMALESRVSPACGALLQAASAKHCSVSTSTQGGSGMLAQTVRITRLGHRSAKPLEEEGIEGGEGGEERRVGSAWVCVTWDAWAAGVVRHAMAPPPRGLQATQGGQRTVQSDACCGTSSRNFNIPGPPMDSSEEFSECDLQELTRREL